MPAELKPFYENYVAARVRAKYLRKELDKKEKEAAFHGDMAAKKKSEKLAADQKA